MLWCILYSGVIEDSYSSGVFEFCLAGHFQKTVAERLASGKTVLFILCFPVKYLKI